MLSFLIATFAALSVWAFGAYYAMRRGMVTVAVGFTVAFWFCAAVAVAVLLARVVA